MSRVFGIHRPRPLLHVVQCWCHSCEVGWPARHGDPGRCWMCGQPGVEGTSPYQPGNVEVFT